MAAPELRKRVAGSPFKADEDGAIRRELDEIWRILALLVDGEHEVLTIEPTRPTLGMVVQADGSTWNPGSGAGLYSYEGTSTASAAWTKL